MEATRRCPRAKSLLLSVVTFSPNKGPEKRDDYTTGRFRQTPDVAEFEWIIDRAGALKANKHAPLQPPLLYR